ncbi:nucleoside triphosphate pyrophosphohydrolase [Psychromonas sp. Urea-02u-13]|uniref:nucleoside triphosphate pyrophosphohydrolase n=1 Tax=Psychromonas sp. Urea-02u-13 TaxID=2058326 RepID=UPI000C323DA2|nr:nucleoside triphosphate pyrophosphohydrolase [Psychromonas sp. Urea-02u-13]PKG39929.1 nucleoside triphosphate pyrophosphohydrolase [Psychromonas sp. Urea-02u-13]
MQSTDPLASLLNIMHSLRDPETGCPWDKKQTFASVVPHTIEEVYELADAIELNDFSDLKGELGDLLFQVVFYAQIAKEQGLFEFSDILETLNEKLIRRHPHVFAQTAFTDEQAVHANWEKEKQKERLKKSTSMNQQESVLDNIPLALPALNRAYKIQKRCANVGFDWAELEPVVAKIHEEIDEVLVEVKRTDLTDEQRKIRIEDELGDLLFANVNLVRHLSADPETVLRQANKKFEKRFRLVEQTVIKQGKQMQDCSLEELEAIWVEVKKLD